MRLVVTRLSWAFDFAEKPKQQDFFDGFPVTMVIQANDAVGGGVNDVTEKAQLRDTDETCVLDSYTILFELTIVASKVGIKLAEDEQNFIAN